MRMAEKWTTLKQLEKLALKAKADSVARVAELAELAAAGLEDVQHVGVTLTLPSKSWISGVQTVGHEVFLANSAYRYLVGCDATCLGEYSNAVVKADNVTVNGQMTFRCETTPTKDLTVNIIRLGIGG